MRGASLKNIILALALACAALAPTAADAALETRASSPASAKRALPLQMLAHAIVVRTSPAQNGVAPEDVGKVEVWYDAGIAAPGRARRPPFVARRRSASSRAIGPDAAGRL